MKPIEPGCRVMGLHHECMGWTGVAIRPVAAGSRAFPLVFFCCKDSGWVVQWDCKPEEWFCSDPFLIRIDEAEQKAKQRAAEIA